MASKEEKKKEKLSWKESVVLYLHDWLFLLITIFLLFLLVFRVIVVDGDSMFSTLWDGDYLLLLGNVFYQEPERGDIVVISKKTYDNGSPIIKRVIATEGQTVDIDFDDGVVYVDGKALDEPYVNEPVHDRENFEGKITVPEGCVFVMGDNRNASTDSRDARLGCVDERYIMGRVYFTLFPVKNIGVVK